MATTYQIKIQLLGSDEPAIWRRILVPSDTTFEKLHYIIQKSMGWENEHLYLFRNADDCRIGWEISDERGLKKPFGFYTSNVELLANQTAIEEFFNLSNPSILYTYDFGDGWNHLLILEDNDVKGITNYDSAHCIGGEGCCPPEDCGGISAYQDIVAAIKNEPEKAVSILNDEDSEDDEYDEDEDFDDDSGDDSEIDDDESEDDSDEEDNDDEDEYWDDEEEDENYNRELDPEEVLEWVRGNGVFFEIVDGKPDFSKIDIEDIEEAVSDIKLEKIYPYRQKGVSKYQAALRKSLY